MVNISNDVTVGTIIMIISIIIVTSTTQHAHNKTSLFNDDMDNDHIIVVAVVYMINENRGILHCQQ